MCFIFGLPYVINSAFICHLKLQNGREHRPEMNNILNIALIVVGSLVLLFFVLWLLGFTFMFASNGDKGSSSGSGKSDTS